LIAAGISLAIIAIVNGLGTKLMTKLTSINTSLKVRGDAHESSFRNDSRDNHPLRL
jgi:hypothetical protein